MALTNSGCAFSVDDLSIINAIAPVTCGAAKLVPELGPSATALVLVPGIFWALTQFKTQDETYYLLGKILSSTI